MPKKRLPVDVHQPLLVDPKKLGSGNWTRSTGAAFPLSGARFPLNGPDSSRSGLDFVRSTEAATKRSVFAILPVSSKSAKILILIRLAVVRRHTRNAGLALGFDSG